MISLMRVQDTEWKHGFAGSSWMNMNEYAVSVCVCVAIQFSGYPDKIQVPKFSLREWPRLQTSFLSMSKSALNLHAESSQLVQTWRKFCLYSIPFSPILLGNVNLFAHTLCGNRAFVCVCISGSPRALQMPVCRAWQDVVILPDGLRRHHVLWSENVGKVEMSRGFWIVL